MGSKVCILTRLPTNRLKSSLRLSLRSRPGELASNVYSAPGTRSSTSSKTPKSRLKAAQSSWVMPLNCSTLSLPSTSRSGRPSAPFPSSAAEMAAFSCARPSAFFSRKIRRVRSFAGPMNSISTRSRPCEAATLAAADRISSSFSAIVPSSRRAKSLDGDLLLNRSFCSISGCSYLSASRCDHSNHGGQIRLHTQDTTKWGKIQWGSEAFCWNSPRIGRRRGRG